MTTNAFGLNIILLANQPRIFRELLHRALDTAQSSQLIVEVSDLKRLPKILDRVHARWLVITLDPEQQVPPPISDLIDQHPDVSVIGVSADGSRVGILDTHTAHLNGPRQWYRHENMSLAELLAVLCPAPQSIAL
jgi:hypothetical protein